MEFKIAFLIIRFLKENVCADSRILELSVIFDCRGRNIHVHPAYIAVFMVNGVNRINALNNVLYRVINGILARLKRKALMAHVLKGNYFVPNLLLGEFFPCDVLVLQVVRTVNAAVDAII